MYTENGARDDNVFLEVDRALSQLITLLISNKKFLQILCQ